MWGTENHAMSGGPGGAEESYSYKISMWMLPKKSSCCTIGDRSDPLSVTPLHAEEAGWIFPQSGLSGSRLIM